MPRRRSRRHETVHSLDACIVRSKDAHVTNLDVECISSPRLDAIELAARQRINAVNAELSDLRERVRRLERLMQFNTIEDGAVVITGAPLVVR